MINILLALSVAIFSYQMFSLTAKISNLNKTLVNLPMSIFSYSVPLVNEDVLYFGKEELENKLDEYFNKNISSIVKDYSATYTYYSSSSNSICMSSECDIVKISLEAKIDSLYTYHKAMKYQVRPGYGQK